MKTLANKVNILFERNYQSNDQPVTDVIKCKILGIKQANWIPDRPIPTYEGNEMTFNGLKSVVVNTQLKS